MPRRVRVEGRCGTGTALGRERVGQGPSGSGGHQSVSHYHTPSRDLMAAPTHTLLSGLLFKCAAGRRTSGSSAPFTFTYLLVGADLVESGTSPTIGSVYNNLLGGVNTSSPPCSSSEPLERLGGFPH
eukprot:scaffold23658_cov61-Phaeocystis_antarctica.AAC.3